IDAFLQGWLLQYGGLGNQFFFKKADSNIGHSLRRSKIKRAMNTSIRKNLFNIIAIRLDAIAGFLYGEYVGCNTGTCAITSNPLNSTLYGSVMGGLVFSMFKNNKKEKNDISGNN